MIGRVSQLYGAFTVRQLGVIAVFALFVSALLAFSRPIVLLVDGERVDSDVPPITTASERAFVPLRSIADALGAETEVDPKNGAIDVVLGGGRRCECASAIRTRLSTGCRLHSSIRPFAFAGT